MTPEQTLDWLAEQHKSQCNEDRPVQEWIRSMKSMLPAPVQPIGYVKLIDTPFGEKLKPVLTVAVPVGAKLYTTPPAAQPAVPEEIMHWDGDDGEDGPHNDIASLLNNMLSNRDLEVGEKIHITRATRLPDVWVRVTKIPEDADVEYEVITAAAPEKGNTP